jgi:hypothetical protein
MKDVFCYSRTQKFHVRWVPCHHSMVRPQVADGQNGLQLWRVASNTLNKQWRTADEGCPLAWGLGMGLTTSHQKNLVCYENSY